MRRFTEYLFGAILNGYRQAENRRWRTLHVKLEISSRNIDLNVEAEGYIRKKTDRLERHLRSIAGMKVEISRTSARSQADRIVVQMTIDAGGYTLRGQEAAPNLFRAVDAVADAMDRQIQRYKGKVYRSEQSRKSAKTTAAIFDSPDLQEPSAAEVESLLEIGKVVRTKRFSIAPMTVEDAIDQMELLNHDFFLFFNLDHEGYNVVYRRHDGDYGLIEPELE